jgi:hypothetical protein
MLGKDLAGTTTRLSGGGMVHFCPATVPGGRGWTGSGLDDFPSTGAEAPR